MGNVANKGYRPFGSPAIRKATKENAPSAGKPYWNSFFSASHPDLPDQLNIWPDEDLLPNFRALVNRFNKDVDAFGKRLMPVFARALDLVETYFDDKGFDEETRASVALTIYPDAQAKRLGYGGHTDPGVLTMLAQAKDQKPGLEVCLPDGTWVRPTPVPHSILLNPGDLLRAWTNHKWLSTLHRVVNVPGQDRYSCPFFWGPNPEVKVAVVPTCISPENPAKYDPISYGEWRAAYFEGTYSGMRTLSAAQQKAAELGLGNGQSSFMPGEDDGTLFVSAKTVPPKSAL